jgi:hypothetical protein
MWMLLLLLFHDRKTDVGFYIYCQLQRKNCCLFVCFGGDRTITLLKREAPCFAFGMVEKPLTR